MYLGVWGLAPNLLPSGRPSSTPQALMKVLVKSLTSTSFYLLLIIVCQNPPYLCYCPPIDFGDSAKVHHILCQCPPAIYECAFRFSGTFSGLFCGLRFPSWENNGRQKRSTPSGQLAHLGGTNSTHHFPPQNRTFS
jgi:hypothetical protein